MNWLNSILLFCAVSAINCALYQDISPEANIDKTAHLGKYITIEKGVTIKENVNVQNYATIKEDTSVGKDSDLGKYSTIDSNTVLEDDVKLEQYATIGKRNTIGFKSVVFQYATTKDNVKTGKEAQIHKYATVYDDTEINDGAILNRYSKIMKNVKIHQKAYVGEYATVQQNAVINELAVVHKYVIIPEGRSVQRNQVVIRAPSSAELYKVSDKANDIPNEMVTLAANQGNSDKDSLEFNNMMRDKLDAQLNELKTNCGQSNNKPIPQNLRRLISLYLIGYHGLNSYNENYRAINGGWFGRITNNLGLFGCSLRQQLQNEYHFGSNQKRTILKPEVQKKMMQVIALAEDRERDYRVAGDTICSMITQIISAERDVSCADREIDSRC